VLIFSDVRLVKNEPLKKVPKFGECKFYYKYISLNSKTIFSLTATVQPSIFFIKTTFLLPTTNTHQALSAMYIPCTECYSHLRATWNTGTLLYVQNSNILHDYGLHIGQAATTYVFLCWHATPSKHNSQYTNMFISFWLTSYSH